MTTSTLRSLITTLRETNVGRFVGVIDGERVAIELLASPETTAAESPMPAREDDPHLASKAAIADLLNVPLASVRLPPGIKPIDPMA